MRSAPRGLSAADLVLRFLPLVASSCFVDAPDADDAASSSSSATTEVDSTSSTGNAPETADTTSSDEITTEPSTTTDTSTSAAESSSTGSDPPQCGCPEPNVFCEGFEDYPGPWGMPNGGGGTEAQDDDAMCGASSALLSVQPTDEFAALSGAIGATAAELYASPHSVRTFMKLDLGCANQGDFVRLLDVQYLKTDGTHVYTWQIAVGNGQTRLTGTNLNDGPVNWYEGTLLPDDEWFAMQLDVDFTMEPPAAVLSIDGEPWLASDATAMLLELDNDTATPGALILGPYLYDQPFAMECNVRYDDVSVAFVETE